MWIRKESNWWQTVQDFIVVVAEVTDDSGNVRRLAKENIVFTVEGEGRVIGDASINANPRTVEFGSAPVLIRSTRKPGKIKVKAHVQFEGTNAPVATEIEIRKYSIRTAFLLYGGGDGCPISRSRTSRKPC